MINYGKHSINQDDINAVVDVLEHHFLTQGSKVPEFEQALCDYTSAKFCTAVNSGTSGLHVACLALNVGKGDWVWTSPNSFAASANCALYCGAKVSFVDIDPRTRNLCVIALAKKLNDAKQRNELPKVLVVVHFAGRTCDMAQIAKLCKTYGVSIIEDAAHSLGATYQNMPVGSCQYSDLTVLSFHPVKSITTAEGGAILCNDAQLATQCVLYAKHGISRDSAIMTKANHDPWYYEQLCLGYNYRLSDMQAALGISQLSRIDSFMQARRKIAQRYFEALSDLPISLPVLNDLENSSWHLFMIETQTMPREQLYAALHNKGIAVNVHYIPIHTHPYYQSLGFKWGDYPNAEKFYANAITLPIYVGLDDKRQKYVISCLRELLS
ncbi:MAG: UDP-4-amino-4,6-dideoxy-N-acetyl-beta-L-altrosamine transaminase [Glaciecola sp.]